MIYCCGLTADFLVFGTSSGDIKFFFLEDWQFVIEYRHTVAVRKIFPGPVGTKAVFIDDKGDGFVFIPMNDMVFEISNFPPTIRTVLWDNWLLEKGVFCACDEEKVYLYVFSKDTITGSQCVLASTTKMPFGHSPLMLYNGELTCQTQSGKITKLMLTMYGENTPNDLGRDETVQALEQALVMKRFKDAWSICSLLNDNEAWKNFASEAAKNLDIDLAIQVFVTFFTSPPPPVCFLLG